MSVEHLSHRFTTRWTEQRGTNRLSLAVAKPPQHVGRRSVSSMNVQSRVFRPARLGAIALLIQLCGCALQVDEGGRLEHISPAHKPKDFVECVGQLQQRGTKYFSGDVADTEVVELKDVINWLPELAADSDLKRSHWEAVQRKVPQLLALLHAPAEGDSRDNWAKHMAELHDLVPLANTWGPAVKNSRPLTGDTAQEASLQMLFTTVEETSRD